VCPAFDRRRREIDEVTEEENSAKITSQKIRIVESKYFNNWLDFLENDNMNSEYNDDEISEEFLDDEDDYPEKNNRTVLLAIGIILVLVIVGLGVLVGVVVSYTKKKTTKKQAKTPDTGYHVHA